MLTIEESIPEKSEKFLKGLDVFYFQFNDISFYIEDEDQENFYFEILVNLFKDLKLTKIFPLRGKKNVTDQARENIGDKTKVYIVDKDFDDLLGKKIVQDNLFYLRKYSIENYLLEKDSIVDYVIAENPKLKKQTILRSIDMKVERANCKNLFYELTLLHILAQSKNLPIENTSIPPERFCHLTTRVFNTAQINWYRGEIENHLKQIDGRFSVKSQLRQLKLRMGLGDASACVKHIPGKYLVKYFKLNLEKKFSLQQRGIDSFNFRLAKSCKFSSLDFLKENIFNYIN